MEFDAAQTTNCCAQVCLAIRPDPGHLFILPSDISGADFVGIDHQPYLSLVIVRVCVASNHIEHYPIIPNLCLACDSYEELSTAQALVARVVRAEIARYIQLNIQILS